MSSDTLTKTAVKDGARIVSSELLKEPVKEAVREALREEAAVASTEHDTAAPTAAESEKSEKSEKSGGRSKLLWGTVIAAVLGTAALARRRMRSNEQSWSGPSPESVAADEAETGYASEGEMQTAEGAGESEDVDHSTSTTE